LTSFFFYFSFFFGAWWPWWGKIKHGHDYVLPCLVPHTRKSKNNIKEIKKKKKKEKKNKGVLCHIHIHIKKASAISQMKA